MYPKPHEREIDFNPEVRLRQMAIEQYHASQTRAADYTTKGKHDRAITRSIRALRRRNAEGVGFSVIYLGTIISEKVTDWSPFLHSSLGAIATGCTVGLMCNEVSSQNRKAKESMQSAIRFAAYEVEASKYEGVEAPDWAIDRLQEAETTAEQVLKRGIA